MKFIDFRDHCVITRGGSKDAWDNPIGAEVIYDGDCNYQEGGVVSTRVFTVRGPVVFLPGAVRVDINDALTVTTETGREIKSVVKVVRDINLPWRAEARVTRIELKQAQGD